jgi:putative ABC transport system permease protein
MKLLPFDYAARNAGRKPLRTALTTIGAGSVVFLVILMGSFVQSLAATMRSSGEARNVIVLGLGSEDFLEQSEISPAVPTLLAASVSNVVKKNEQPLLSPEIHHSAIIRTAANADADERNVHKGFVRGVTPMAFQVHRQVYLMDGRLPESGEVLVGRLAGAKLGLPPESLALGSEVSFEGRNWKVVGHIEAPGTVYEAELWVPMQDLKLQTKRDTITCVVARMLNESDFSELDLFCKSRLDLELSAVRESSYYGGLAKFFRPMQVMGWVMALLVVASGLFGGLNTMIAAIASRTRELACLETLGYQRRAVVISLLQESLLQVGTGTLLAAGLAALLLSGTAVRFTMGAIALQVDGMVLSAGIAAGLILAVLGTLIPASRLVRTPLVELLRA